MRHFRYEAPTTLDDAMDLLGNADAAPLAGGQTLVPTMKEGLAAPETLVDLAAIAPLGGVAYGTRSVEIGAMRRHSDVATDPGLRRRIPGLVELAGSIGDAQVRNRGTLGGSIANNDPSADYPAACLGLAATVHTDRREIAADAFFRGLFETALDPGELIIAVTFPHCRRSAYVKFRNPASRFAIVGVFAADLDHGPRLAVTGAGANGVFRWTAAEKALAHAFHERSLAPVFLGSEDMLDDMHAAADYRAHLTKVMAVRAVTAARRRSRTDRQARIRFANE